MSLQYHELLGNEVLAIADGWKLRISKVGSKFVGYRYIKDGIEEDRSVYVSQEAAMFALPDYLHDLNLLSRIEQKLSEDEKLNYLSFISQLLQDQTELNFCNLLMATAEQRSTALIKLLYDTQKPHTKRT